MKRARFVAPAKAELLAEVAYYNNKELGLGSRFLAVVEDATARGHCSRSRLPSHWLAGVGKYSPNVPQGLPICACVSTG
jgi:hypothetical protein